MIANGYPGGKIQKGPSGGFVKFANIEDAAEAHAKVIDSMLGDVIPEQETVEVVAE
jgi:hypothetical protein